MHDLLSESWAGYSYGDWLDHFRENDAHRLEQDFEYEPEPDRKTRKLIFPSIAAFRKGESSDGVHLALLAEEFGEKHGEPLYPGVMKLFVKEENFHSAYLAQYMKHHGEPEAKHSGLDRTFRKLRHKGSLFTEIAVLVTAEMIALSYYSALGNVADRIGSKALRRICDQMLHDELPHIVFQSHTLSYFSNSIFTYAFRRSLMGVTTLAVYAAYGRLLRRGGYGYFRFRRENMGYLRQSVNIVRAKKSARGSGK